MPWASGVTACARRSKSWRAVGLVESRIGEGAFLTNNTGASFGRILGLSLATWGGTIMELLDARKMIEVEAARAAAQRATPAEIKAIESELRAMQANMDRVGEYLIADFNFHRRIGEASHNAIIGQFVVNVIDLLEEVLKGIAFRQPAGLGRGRRHPSGDLRRHRAR